MNEQQKLPYNSFNFFSQEFLQRSLFCYELCRVRVLDFVHQIISYFSWSMETSATQFLR